MQEVSMSLGIAIAGVLIGFSIWILGKVMVRVGEAMERWGNRH